MKRFINAILIFIPFSVIIFAVLLYLSYNLCITDYFKLNLNYNLGAYGHMFTRIKEAKETRNIDVLFLGSSHTYRGFDTRIFKAQGITCFNLGSSSQTPVQTEILLERYLDNLNPKIIVYEVFPDNFIGDGVESSTDIISNDRNDMLSLKMALTVNNVKIYNTLFYGVICDILGKNRDFTEEVVNGEDKYIAGGYVEKKMKYYKHIQHPYHKWEFNSTQLDVFEMIIKNIKERGITLVMVYAPITTSYYNSFTNNNYFDSIIKPYGRYYDFNKILKLDDSLYFYDEHHLNQQGVCIFNNKLIEILKADGYLNKNFIKK